MMKWVARGICLVLIVFCAVAGFYYTTMYHGAVDNTGVAMVRLLYEYDSIQDVYGRETEIKSRCSSDVWEEISFDNSSHFDGTWGRTKNLPSRVRVILTRPGMVVYALENDFVDPRHLWCFEYELSDGVFISVREYQLVALRNSEEGGFF